MKPPPNKSSHSNLKKQLLTTGVALLLVAALISTLYLSYQQLPQVSSTQTQPKPSPQPEKYKIASEDLKQQRLNLKKRFLATHSPSEKKKILNEARQTLHLEMPKLMRYWIGTPWDFNGTSTTPGEGKIACGYFVSTVLRDTGFNINRITLAQQASQNIIISLIHSSDKIVNPKRNYAAFIDYFKDQPEGIYIIGLDTHVGYLLNLNNEVHFIHSGGRGVVDETEHEARDVKASNYRVIGNITQHDYLLKKWILGESIKTKR